MYSSCACQGYSEERVCGGRGEGLLTPLNNDNDNKYLNLGKNVFFRVGCVRQMVANSDGVLHKPFPLANTHMQSFDSSC